MGDQIAQVITIVIGATLIGLSTTWMIGFGVCFIAHAIMPAQHN